MAFVSSDLNNPAAVEVLLLLLEAEFLIKGKRFFKKSLCRQIKFNKTLLQHHGCLYVHSSTN